jgi:hypothetical protein
MTNFTLNQQDVKQIKRCISDLFAQMTTDYQQTRAERREVAAAFPPSDEAFSAIEELELLTSDLRGYASQIQVRDSIENPAAAIDRLQTMRIFSIPSIAQFYFDHSRDYPKLTEYVRQLDYIRLLLLEYLQSYPTTRIDPRSAK